MKVTLSLDEGLVKEAWKIAVRRDTTLTGLIRDYLEKLAGESAASGGKRQQVAALEQSFRQLQIRVGERGWRRDELYHRSHAMRPRS
jgi:hypothetical protein